MNWARILILSRTGKRKRTRLYEVWASMRKRCLVPTCIDYKRYGARGITICVEWLDEFANFRAWAISSGYRKGLTLDRIDVNGRYEPANCRWIPKGEQQLNTRRTHVMTLNGQKRTLMEWAKIRELNPDVIRGRIQQGWNDEHALTIPIGGNRPLEFQRKRGRKPRIDVSPR